MAHLTVLKSEEFLAKVVKQHQATITATEKGGKASLLYDRETVARALNALKNQRRVVLLQLLQDKPLTQEEIQEKLHSIGYNHGLVTIQQYLQPLIDAELVTHKDARYSTTSTGKQILELVSKVDFLLRFPANSSCFEELSLLALKNGHRTFEELAKIVDRPLLPRALDRLQKEDLIRSNHPKDHVQFYRVRVRLMGGGTSTEKRVFHAVSQDGISVNDLAKAAGINVRRTYKYIARLKKRGLILQRKLPVTYDLTPTGKIVADFIEQVLTRILDRPVKTILTPLDTEELGTKASLAIIRQYGRKGVLQSDLWRRLDLDSRKGSRQVLNLEKRGFIERKRELNKGRWTFRLFTRQGVETVDTIAGIPCVSCDEDYKGSCPTHVVNPETCSKLTRWVIDLNREDPQQEQKLKTTDF